MKKSFAEILDNISDGDVSRMEKKMPEWSGVEGLRFPSRLCTEQCSSSVTAEYKASLCTGAQTIVDLTGGLGVDCWAFSRVASRVHYNEMNTELFEAVKDNYSLLGVDNATFSNAEVRPGMVAEMMNDAGISPDIIFLDPARRSASGKKVFLLEDCQPDILTLKDELLGISPMVMVKLSPMADISMVCDRLGDEVKEVHVVGADGECKELLVILQRGWDQGYSIHVGRIVFTRDEEKSAAPVFFNGDEDLSRSSFLFEPSSSLLKSGAFNLMCARYGFTKLGRFTHLYCRDSMEGAENVPGKWFGIDGIVPFSGKTLKALGHDHPRCEVTARNLPMSSDEMRKRMGVTSGGDTHIFGAGVDFSAKGGERRIFICSRINPGL